jgi:hypothetical protein
MPNYQNGKIYKITSGDLTYIGSTCEPTLARRLTKHISGYKSWENGKGNKVLSFTLIETGQYEITLIELFPCGSKDELTARERSHIETTVCVNKYIPTRTKKEYYDVNRENILKFKREQYDTNKEKMKEKNKVYYDINRENILKIKREQYENKIKHLS